MPTPLVKPVAHGTRRLKPSGVYGWRSWVRFAGQVLWAILTLRIFFALHPKPIQPAEAVSPSDAPGLRPGQRLKVMTWNIQFLAGKAHVFFFDVPDGQSGDERPASAELVATLEGAARIIRDEDPDIILLQEVDKAAARSDFQDQLALLLALLPPEYSSWSAAYYWKAGFVPHPHVHGSAGMRLAVISKFKISSAVRHQLPIMPADPVTQHFSLKRAVLEVHLPVAGAPDLVILSTHLSAFAQGYDTLAEQVAYLHRLLRTLESAGHSFILGGDFNLLPDHAAFLRLASEQRIFYNPHSEIAPLIRDFDSVPSMAETSGPDYPAWFTHFPNDPKVPGPDRTIDYLFLSPDLELGHHRVRSKDTLDLSDHLPVLAEVRL